MLSAPCRQGGSKKGSSDGKVGVIALEAGPTDIGGSASAPFFKLLSLWERDIVSV
jgi:hypothetical protein